MKSLIKEIEDKFDEIEESNVTANLDEGPIIAQEVKPINHTFTIKQMVHMGHDLEATALSHAVRIHAEQRVCLNGDKTVILA